MVATTDQKARMFDLITGVSELTRDGNRDFEEVLAILQIIKNEKDGPKRLLENLIVVTPIPAEDEIFELTLNTQTCYFKLVRVGDYHNLDELRQRLVSYDAVPEDQWCKAFMAKYPRPDKNGPIGLANSRYVYPPGYRGFPCLGSFGKIWELSYHHAECHLNSSWRWLVAASK